MGNRAEFSTILRNTLGSNNVYFQPPSTIKMNYPAIVYSIVDLPKTNADNVCYKYDKKYQVTLIDRNPDNLIVDKLIRLPYSRFKNHSCVDGLNNYTFEIYY